MSIENQEVTNLQHYEVKGCQIRHDSKCLAAFDLWMLFLILVDTAMLIEEVIRGVKEMLVEDYQNESVGLNRI